MFFIPQRWEISERLVLLREVFPVFISLQLCVCIRVHVGINTHICIYTHHTHLYVNIYTLCNLTLGCSAGANTQIWGDLCPLHPHARAQTWPCVLALSPSTFSWTIGGIFGCHLKLYKNLFHFYYFVSTTTHSVFSVLHQRAEINPHLCAVYDPTSWSWANTGLA